MFQKRRGVEEEQSLLIEVVSTIDDRDENDCCLLDHAVKQNNPHAIYWLIQNAGANPNNINGLSRTPLYYAIKYKHEKCTQMLLECGAFANLVTIDFIQVNPPSWIRQICGINWLR